jgi:hypothetical protein
MPKALDPPADVQLQIRMPVALHDKLRRKAFNERRTLAGAARVLIEEGLKRKAEPRP